MNSVRIDKWLWAVRIFKTRTVATDACKKGRVMLGGVAVKPSREVKVGDVVEVRKSPVTYSFRVLALAQNRMGARLVPQYMENVTTPDQLQILDMQRIAGFVDRRKGLGRPTKRESRDLERFTALMGGDDGFPGAADFGLGFGSVGDDDEFEGWDDVD